MTVPLPSVCERDAIETVELVGFPGAGQMNQETTTAIPLAAALALSFGKVPKVSIHTS